MKHDKLWWSGLTKNERTSLFYLITARGEGHSSYIPDDCGECPMCSTPHLGYGLCPLCRQERDQLIAKADEAMVRTVFESRIGEAQTA